MTYYFCDALVIMVRSLFSRSSIFYIVLALIAAAAVGMLLYSTPEGLELSDDSIAYIAGARSILAGNGYREAWLASDQPVTHFPPGFPAMLALIGLSGLDPLRGARFLNALLFGGNAVLLGIVGWRMTKSQVAGIILALLFAINGSLLRVHTTAMSEPLYTFLSLAAFLSFATYMESSPSPIRRGVRGEVWLILAADFTGMAYLTRYAGLALIATFIVTLFILHDEWKKRLTSAGLFLAGVLPWMIAWAIRNRVVAENATNRILEWHPITLDTIIFGVRTFASFLLPIETWRRPLIKIPGFFETIVLIIGLGLSIWIVPVASKRLFRADESKPEIFSFTSGLYIFAYLASIIASMSLFDASTKFKLRILSPVYVSLLILLIAALAWLWQKRERLWQSLTILLALSIMSVSVYDLSMTVSELHRGGQGYASFQWYDSMAMAFLRGLPKDVAIYTNEPGAVYLYTGRGAYVLPDTFDPVTAQPRPGFEQGIARLQADILKGKAVLALFDGGDAPASDLEMLTKNLPLAQKSSGDVIYAVEGLK